MDRGPDVPPSALAPVPAYPRRAVEQYLADARGAWDHLQVELRAEQARHTAALDALAAADESHRVLGSMVVEAQQDLAARRAHAEAAAATLLANADDEAARIVAAARSQATLILGDLPSAASPSEPLDRVLAPAPPTPAATAHGHAPLDATDDRDPGRGESDSDEPPWGDPPVRGRRPADTRPAPPAPFGDEAPAHAVAAVEVEAVGVELWPDRHPASVALDGLRWRPRWRRAHEQEWRMDAGPDESYFTRLRDELRADGTINAWFEPA